jgi:endo-1,4-beta-xylanase
LVGCTGSNHLRGAVLPSSTGASAGPGCDGAEAAGAEATLWQQAIGRGLVYGSSTATWQISDRAYRRLFGREAAILFTEDDLLWWRLRPTPTSDLDFGYGDRIIGFAEDQGMLVFGAHLVWDQGYGDGWTDRDLRGLSVDRARTLLFGTVEDVARRYRGRMAGWSVANEVVDSSGLRTDVPWFATIGPTYVEEAFHVAHEADPQAVLVLNDFGFETDEDFAPAEAKRAAALDVLGRLVDTKVPVHALGIQAHLNAGRFRDGFDADAYRRFLSDVAGLGVHLLITELDVLDDGLPPAVGPRDRGVADVVSRYLDVALDEPAVVALMTFGLSDRYTWLQEDYPRQDGASRRPLPFDDRLRPTPEYEALTTSLTEAPVREGLWRPPRC